MSSVPLLHTYSFLTPLAILMLSNGRSRPMVRLPILIDKDLSVRIGAAAVRLTPSQAMQAAEQLIRKGTRAMMVEEALAEPPRSTSRRRRAN
jgi:hypothetical protein